MTRPPPRDQPARARTALLVADLRRSVEVGRMRAASRFVRGPDRSRHVRVREEGRDTPVTVVSLVVHGQVVAERVLPTADLVAVLERDGASWETLAAVAES